MKFIKRIPLVILTAFAGFILVLLVLSLLNHIGLFSVRSIAAGFDYLPPLWLLILTLPVCVGFLSMKFWRTAFCLFSIVFAFFLFYGDISMRFLLNQNTSGTEKHQKISVLTYNVRYYSRGIDRLADFFKKTNADVYLLCESVLDSQRIGYLQTNLSDYFLISDRGHDTSILSRYPVIEYEIVTLPSYLASLSGGNDLEQLAQKGEYRAFVHAVIDVEGIPVNVLSVRLIAGRAKDKSLRESWKWGRYLLHAQDREQKVFLDYVDSLQGPVIFGGDLNAPPSARVIKTFRRVARDAYFADHMFGNFTFRTSFPTMRLDYIFHSPDLVPVDSKIIRTELSDHYPVTCTFRVSKPASLALDKH